MATHTPPSTDSNEAHLTPEQFQYVRDMLVQYSGVHMDKMSQRVLTTSIQRRLHTTGMDIATYSHHINHPTGKDELHQLSELVLNHETIFFRNQPHVRALRNIILPQLHRRKPLGEPLRIWSAGCSTGEEPYSLAIIALETLGRLMPRPIEIWATDLSKQALAKAEQGMYRGRTMSNVLPEQRIRHFTYHNEYWHVKDTIRQLVTFEQLNLLSVFPRKAHGLDIIFCQNVTIYFEVPTFRALVDRFYNVLPEGGLLFLGFSETLWNIYDKFRLREVENAFVYEKEAPTASKPLASQQPSSRPLHRVPHIRSQTDTPTSRARATSPQHTATHRATEHDYQQTLQKARDLLDAGQVELVIETLNTVPLNGHHAPKTLALIAQAHANRGDLDMAAAEARRAIELNALTTEPYVLLGVLYARQGEFAEASQQLERARYLEPDSALISFHLAEVYRHMKRTAAAIREYRNALQKLSSYAPEVVLDGVSVLLLRETCERYVTILA